MKRLFVILLFAFLITEVSYSQLSINSAGTNYIIDFDNTVSDVNNGQFAGIGFASNPSIGRLDSDAWEATGMSDGNLSFGGTRTSGDFARGMSAGNVSTGGFYSFEVETGNYAIGMQPGGSDWTPGTITLRIQNNTGAVISSLNLSYEVWFYDDQSRSNSIEFLHSSDNITYITEPSLYFNSPASPLVVPEWYTVSRNITLTGITILDGDYYYLRWRGDDVSGSGARDEFALDDIIVSTTASTPPDDPTTFSSIAISSDQIDLSWTKNTDNDNVMVAYTLDGIFGVPLNGTNYNANDIILGGGEVIYNGPLISFSHTGLASNTQYFYCAWSVDGSINYSSGLVDDATTFPIVNTDLVISEIADPEDISNAKFVELYNTGSNTIDFSVQTWYLLREANGGTSLSGIQLDPSATLAPGATWIVAYDLTNGLFLSTYNFLADQTTTTVASGNGDDSYFLYYGGDQSSGTLVDIYGEWGVDGTGEPWEYVNSKATRKRHITTPNNVWSASEWVIIPATASEMTPGWHDRDLTWNGGSTDWNNANNWNNSGTSPRKYPPDAGCDIVIPNLANDPIISGRASTNNMELETGAEVTITPTNFLVTGSAIDNQAGTSGLNVKSDASGDGMLLLGSGTTQATIERYLTDDMSHFISAPTSNATADNLFQDHNPEVYLYEHHEWDDSYNFLVPTSTPMPSGKGFSTWVEDFTPDYIVAEFDGNLMSSDLTLNTSTTPAMSYTYIAPPNDTLGYNLLGNPYPIPISWKKGSWAKNNVEYTIWIWEPFPDATADEPDGQWLVTTTSGGGNFNGVVPSGQAFFVRANASSPSITIPADARTVYYPSTTYYKTREDDNDSSTYAADYVTIKAMNDEDEEEIWISFNEFGTEDFDNGWDASKLRNSYSIVTLFIPKESRDQCIEHLPTLLPDEERIVEIGFETTAEGEHSLVIDATYMPDTDITLEDLKYDQMQNMDSDSIYTFVAFADDDPNRFRIHFNKTTTGIEFEDFNHHNEESIQIYSYGKHVYIKKEDISSSGYVMLYDMYGREVLSHPLEQTSLMKIPVQLNNSYLVVKVISDSKVFTSKVYIK
jgi:hypothetical protein